MRQVKRNNRHAIIKIRCKKCGKDKKFQSLELFLDVASINYEILALVYKTRPKIAERAENLYELKEDD